MCEWEVSLRFFLFRVFFNDFIEYYVFRKKIYSSKIGMPIWHIMLAFMQENVVFIILLLTFAEYLVQLTLNAPAVGFLTFYMQYV